MNPNFSFKMIRCAVVGTGRIGSLLEKDPLREKPCTHAGAITDNPETLLAGGCDIDPERRKEFSLRWGCDAVFGDAEELLKAVKPDILHIATHPDSHLYMVELAARYGVPTVVCEKPLADTLKGARKIARIHSRGIVKVLVNHERRYSADYIAVRQAVERKEFGELLSVSGKLFFGRDRKLKAMMIHDGTHLADAVLFLTGAYGLKKKYVTGTLSSSSGTAWITAASKNPDIPVLIEAGAGRDHLVFELDLSFETGRIRIGNGILEWYRSEESPYYEGFRSLVPECTPKIDKTGYFSNMMADAVLCTRDRLREPVSTAVHGYEVIKFILSL